MKQFDTVKNNEWVPVEEDLENTIKVVDSLPTASENELGNTYLLNGAMEGYTKTHFYKCLKDETTGLYYWSDLNVGRYSVGNCKSVKLMVIDDGLQIRVLVSWRDPDDVIVGSEKIFWQKTCLVHQVGHMPIDINDGTLILTNNVRDKYAVFGSYSTTIAADNRVHYFKLFPVSEDNAITNDDANGRRAGYNYQITADTKPIYTDATTYKTYYKKTLDSSTGLTRYEALAYNSTNFDGTAPNWTFKTTIAYYEYQTAYITWSSLRELIQDGQAGLYFPVGSILVLPYHGDFGEMSYEVVDFDGVQLADSSKHHSMTLQAKYLYRWWDYEGGVVFDTNEKAGVLTNDTVRDIGKVYFKRLNLASTNGSNPFDVVSPFAEIKTQEGTSALYAESIADANICENNDTYPMGIRGQRYLWEGTTGDTYKWKLPSLETLYECELPYTTVYNPDVWPSVALPGQNNAKTTLSIAKASQYPCSDMRRTDALYELTRDTVFMPNKSYFKLVSGNYTYQEVTPGTAITADTYYETTSRVVRCPLNSSLATYACQATVPSMYIIKDFVAAANGWSGIGNASGTHTTFAPYTRQPRGNQFADRFLPVIPMNNGNNSLDYRVFIDDVKYYVPSEVFMQRYVNWSTSNTNKTYTTKWQVLARDCTAELSGIYRYIKFTAATATDLDPYKYCHAYVEGPYTSSASNYYVSVDRICGALDTGVDAGGDALPDLNNPRPWLLFPTTDERYIQGKIYYKATYTKLAGSYQVQNGDMICEYVSGTAITGGNYKNPPHYRRVYISTGTTLAASHNYYRLTFTRMDPTTGTPSGNQYVVGDLVPIVSGVPYFVRKKTCTDATSQTNTDYVYTMGDKDASGEYIRMVYDFGGRTVAAPVASTATDSYGNMYCPSVSAGTSVYTGSTTSNFIKGASSDCYRTTDIYEGAINIITRDQTDTTDLNLLARSGCRVYRQDTAASFVNNVTRYYYLDSATSKYRTVDCANASEFNAAKTAHTTLYYRRWVTPGTSNTATTFKYSTSVLTVATWATQSTVSYTGPIYLECNNLFFKTPNTERVAYGNHVWAQSNLRMYFNGPMDNSAVYQLTPDTVFHDGHAYYRYASGSGYMRMTKDVDYTVGDGIVNGISQSQKSSGTPVYFKYVGGIPVGYKIDPYNPMKYWNYGVSPVQQYKYNGVSNTWTTVFNDGDTWWVGQPSINNGLVYDQLAPMYWSGCVLTGVPNNTTKRFSAVTTRNGSGYNTAHVPVDSTTSSSGSWSGVLDSTGAVVKMTSDKITPRQSFLHGFLDCMYKRSTDTTADASKTYYFRNPYGEYEIQNNSSDVVRDGPFKSCLYEYNTNWLNDIADAKDFLDAIQPVVNHNGCYGTSAAYDFYVQEALGTTTLDKVWLASTVQVAGVASHTNSGKDINANCINNGVYENTTPNTFKAEANRGSSIYLNYKWALAKYADATDATATDPKYGATTLDKARIKYGYTIGQHTTSGYGDKLDVAQYWWLRSAGGYLGAATQGSAVQSYNICMCIVYNTGVAEYNGNFAARRLDVNDKRLSPLITLG